MKKNYLHLILAICSYKLRVESMLLKEEFATNLGFLEPSINAILFAGDDLMNNVQLREVLYMVVVAGNFLNGNYTLKLRSFEKKITHQIYFFSSLVR